MYPVQPIRHGSHLHGVVFVYLVVPCVVCGVVIFWVDFEVLLTVVTVDFDGVAVLLLVKKTADFFVDIEVPFTVIIGLPFVVGGTVDFCVDFEVTIAGKLDDTIGGKLDGSVGGTL